MNCFECAKTNDTVAAIAICRHCQVGLCFDHLIEAEHFLVGGTHESCPHVIPRTKPLVDIPAGIADSARHHSAGAV
ncbi:MAG TPA: DUF2180 family protein [Gaiellaceae bacterium]|nr:DUF2180 family protein [Gaiellaceae bacterium]